MRFSQIIFASTAAAAIALVSCASNSTTRSAQVRDDGVTPDARAFIAASSFDAQEQGTWLSPEKKAPFQFDELIYSWQVSVPEDQGFRLYLRVGFPGEDFSEWLYAGYWGDVELELVGQRTDSTFSDGHIAMDQLLLKRKADRYQFKVVSRGEDMLSTVPALHVITTDNDRVQALASVEKPMPTRAVPILDIPHQLQCDSDGNKMPDRCQSAALSSALKYYGKYYGLETLVPMIYDYEYDYPGIWPRTLGAATQLGYEGYIDRFRDWESVAKALEQNKVILVSMKMPKDLTYIAPPYASLGGHIIVMNGITPDGRVIVTDSALKEEEGFRCQWLKEDFEKIWFDQKGGVGMVIVPPPGAETKTVAEVAPFPGDRRKK